MFFMYGSILYRDVLPLDIEYYITRIRLFAHSSHVYKTYRNWPKYVLILRGIAHFHEAALIFFLQDKLLSKYILNLDLDLDCFTL